MRRVTSNTACLEYCLFTSRIRFRALLAGPGGGVAGGAAQPAIGALLPPRRGSPAVGGEPAEAVRLRQQMTDTVIAKGWAPSARVQQALRTVPRHRFAPESP